MFPLPAHTVELLLQYVSPLTDALPPHLVSAPLLQRHRFLQLSPSSPVDYLCWPSPDSPRAIDLLDHLHPLSDQTTYPTRYTSDPESTLAHVQIPSSAEGLRVLFLWDDTHGWKYHDLRLMPFPHPSFPTPQESLAARSHPSPNLVAESDHPTSGDDDSYWDAYGAAAHDLISPLPSRNTSKPDAIQGEDAYWAQYASVQGSADSTVPSPLPINRKPRPANPNTLLSQDDSVMDIPIGATHHRPSTSAAGPPSPNTLAHLLSTISPRKDVYSPILDEPYSMQSLSACSVNPSSQQTTSDPELVTSPLLNGYQDASLVSPVAVKINGVPLSKCHPRPLAEAHDKALTDSIKGLYYLWKAGKKGEPGEKDRSGFLQIVQAAIAYE